MDKYPYDQPPFGDVPSGYAHRSRPSSFGDVSRRHAPRSFIKLYRAGAPSIGAVERPPSFNRSYRAGAPSISAVERPHSFNRSYYDGPASSLSDLSGKYHEFSLPPNLEAQVSINQSKGSMKSLEHLKIPLSDILLATHNFSQNYIGSGGYGTVYKAELDHFDNGNSSLLEENHRGELPKKHSTVAIKRILSRADEQGKHGFLTEIELLASCKHLNIVPLIGFCDEGSEKILVYEYAANGSLADYLVTSNMTNLTWDKRIKICMDIAHGLKYLHTDMEGKPMTIHRDIKSGNILIDDNWKAKISDFGLSITSLVNTKANTLNTDASTYDKYGSTIYTSHIAGTSYYLDPEYTRTGRLKKESDIYSLGVLMLEILCGRLAYDPIYVAENEKGLASIARKCFKEGRLKELIDPKLQEIDGNIFMQSRRLNQRSLDIFSKLAYLCVAETQARRPTTEVVIKELEKALYVHMNGEIAHLQIPLQLIVSTTSNFADENIIRHGPSRNFYKGKLLRSGKPIDLVALRFDGMYGKEDEFRTEISLLSSVEHKNLVSIVGFCDENDEKIIIYEHPANGFLDQHLCNPTLKWLQRLQICLGVARALSHIHYDVIHCDINSSKIFLDKDWEPKIFGFELSTKYPQSWRHQILISQYKSMTPKFDVYSFGVLLFEVLCGRKPMIRDVGVKEELDAIILSNLKEQMNTQSLDIFMQIVGKCSNQQLVARPTMDQIVKELEDALEHQMKHENLQQPRAADEGTSSNSSKIDSLKIPLSKIRSATEDFNKIQIGDGGFGTVYKAELNVADIQSLSSMDGKGKDELSKSKTVAIKRIKSIEQGKQGFLAEIELLRRCNHPNVVSLLGFSDEDREMVLVYEFAFMGCLSDYLESTRKINLNWAQRIQICLNVACGLKYLHTDMEGKPTIIHRDIKSDNILLDENLNAKVADFGLSKFNQMNQQVSTIHTMGYVGTHFYLDPEFFSSHKYKKETDVYSFGVVLFEVLSGRLAYDLTFRNENANGLAPIARRRYNEGTLKELIDPTITEEDDETIITLNRGPNQASFDAFSRIANQCLAETQAKRPTMETIIQELERALKLQGETKVLSRFRLNDIKEATHNFDRTYCIGLDAFAMVYKAELYHFDRSSSLATDRKDKSEPLKRTVAIKRISSRANGQGEEGFLAEIEMLSSCKHPNIVSLLGFCDDDHEMIVVYEHASNGSLEEYLRSADKLSMLTWTQRLQKCLEIASGLYHLHTNIDHQQSLIHGDIRSSNILLGKIWEAKIAYFGLSKLHPANEEANIKRDNVAAKVYWDPEYEKTGKLKKESDIYSFGVVLFEIFCGRLAYDQIYMENEKGLAQMAHRSFKDGTIKNMMDPNLKVGTRENDVTSNIGPNEDSLRTFLEIADQCLLETQNHCPTMENVIKELKMALYFQENLMDNLEMSLDDIKSATENFSQENYVESGTNWNSYKGKIALPVVDANANGSGLTNVVVKRFDSKSEFLSELEILFRYKHENIITLVGYCEEMDEKIIVVEYASKGSLDKHLKKTSLTWRQRLKICINVASGLKFLHSGALTLKKVIHGNIKSPSVLLYDDWKAKLSNFEASSIDSSHASHDAHGTIDNGYLDPEYAKLGVLTDKSDIYSLGVILFEILCGRLAWEEGCEDDSQSLGPLAKRRYEEGKLDGMVFEGIRKQVDEESSTAFAKIACKCLGNDGDSRPTASEVVIELKKALEFHEDSENWGPKLPINYKQIIEMSESPDICSTNNKRNLYKILFKGIFLQERKEWFHVSSKGKGNLMISATKFSYENHRSLKWKSTQKSRFGTVAKLMDVSNLKIQIKIETKVLSKDVNYGVHLVFKFRDPRKFSSELMYVHLKYKMGGEKLHSYFATLRDKGEDDGWMMIELNQFLNDKEDTVFEGSIEGFSRYHCGTGAIYVEGLKFLVVENEKQKENKKLKEVDQLPTEHIGESPNDYDREKFLLNIVNGKKNLTLSAKEVFCNSPEPKPFHLKPSAESRFHEVMELLPLQAFRISYKIKREMLTPFTEYACYLVFKLSDKCRGLHCPVKVRDLLHEKNKETKILYFRSPTLLNKKHANWIPEHRTDGWMEAMVWKLNTRNQPVENTDIPMNLKLKTYEGNMSGLIICGLEFRPLVF